MMCTYSVRLSDSLVDRVRPSFPDESSLQVWIEQQVEALLMGFYEGSRRETLRRARAAAQEMREQSERNGNSGMTLDEINEEIRLARAASKVAV